MPIRLYPHGSYRLLTSDVCRCFCFEIFKPQGHSAIEFQSGYIGLCSQCWEGVVVQCSGGLDRGGELMA